MTLVDSNISRISLDIFRFKCNSFVIISNIIAVCWERELR